MNKLLQAALIGGILTVFGGSWYYLFAVVDAVAHGTDLVSVFFNTLGGCLIAWVFFTFLFYEVQRSFDEMNAAGRKRMEEEEEARKRDHNQQQQKPTDRQ